MILNEGGNVIAPKLVHEQAGPYGVAALEGVCVIVTQGPAKDDLLRAVTNTDGQLTAVFDTPAGALEMMISQIEERGDGGVDFTVWGKLTSSDLQGAHFTACYNCASRTGRLALKQATQRFTP